MGIIWELYGYMDIDRIHIDMETYQITIDTMHIKHGYLLIWILDTWISSYMDIALIRYMDPNNYK